MAPNPYITSTKAADAVPAVLHPLVLLSISDHITRHTLREIGGPVVGAIIGQHNGRQITLEHSFDFAVKKSPDNGAVRIDTAWFNDRLEQMRLVHKDRNLDLVGWYTMFSRAGPTASIMQVHDQILKIGSADASATSESAVLLAFHSDDLLQQSVGGRLPITLYETSVKPEGEASAAADESQDQVMEDVSEVKFPFKLSEVSYTVDSGEAEMISVDFVARGAANASTKTAAPGAAAASTSTTAPTSSSATTDTVGSVSPSNNRDRAVAIESANRSKKRLVSARPDDNPPADEETAAPGPSTAVTSKPAAGGTLSAEEEELIATLTTRANAIRMLHARLQLLTKYVESLPADALSEDAKAPEETAQSTASESKTTVSLPILRSIQALVQRLPLVVPPGPEGKFEEERQREANDVDILSLLLDDMIGGISSIQTLHKKYNVMETHRWHTSRQQQQALYQQAAVDRDNGDVRAKVSAGYSSQGLI